MRTLEPLHQPSFCHRLVPRGGSTLPWNPETHMVRQIKQELKRLIPTSWYERYWYYRSHPHKLVYPLYLGWRYECPMCRGRFRKLVPRGLKFPVIAEKQIIGGGYRLNAHCPKCDSFDRERLIYLYLVRCTDFLRRPVRLLHVSPEAQLEKFLRSQTNITYASADLGPSSVDLRLDVTKIPLLDSSIDLIICSHVLEHVPDDRRAMSEMIRVLKPGGSAILQVPISLLQEKTDEDPSVVDAHDREQRFGQGDHVRLYGKDYRVRLESVGFQVEPFSFVRKFGDAARRRYALLEHEDLYVAVRPMGP